MKKIITMLIIIFTLTGCLEKVELRDRAIVQCFGIDFENDSYNITLQIFNSSVAQEGKSADKNSLIVKTQGRTITEAVYNMNNLLGKTIFLGNNKVILIGRKTAENGIEDILDFFDSDYQTRVKTTILICEDTAENTISAKEKEDIISSKDIFAVSEINKEHGIIGNSDILTAETSFHSETCNSFLLGYLKVIKDNNKIYPNIIGSALFKDDKMIDIFEIAESEGATWILGNPKLICISGETTDSTKFSVTAKNIKSKISGEIKQDKIKIKISVKFDGKTDEFDKGKKWELTGAKMEEIEHICNEKVREKIELAVNKSIKNGCDTFNFDNYLSGKNINYVRKNSKNWSQIIKQSKVDIEVKCVLERPII